MTLRAAARIGIVSLLVVLAQPAASAAHWSLHRAGIDDSIARTSEPDGEVVRQAGNPLDGLANRVTPPGNVPGDGSLFLDARLAGRLGAQAGVDLHADDTLAASGEEHLVTPGYQHLSAWYGRWSDLVFDGAIDDRHDALGEAADEFAWRGLGSGEPVEVMTYLAPAPTGTVYGQGNASRADGAPLQDHTAGADQGWYGRVHIALDAPLLSSIWVVAAADATKVAGGVLGIDLTDPNALYDVDRHESVNSDVEALWRTVATASPSAQSATAIASATVGFIVNRQQDVHAALGTPYAREPNHPADDHEGRATFGGFGDAVGTGNTFEGYASGYHFFFDVRPHVYAAVHPYVAVPGTSTEASQFLTALNLEWDPHGVAQGAPGRSAGALVYFKAESIGWHDKNGDGHLGAVCSTTSADYDSAGGFCRNAPRPYPHRPDLGGEVSLAVCGASSVPNGAFTVEPAEGTWPPGTVLARDWVQLTRLAYNRDWVPLSGDEPATLRWRSACTPQSRDAILLPGGIEVPLLVKAEASVAQYKDATSGIDIAGERVVDNDLLAASL